VHAQTNRRTSGEARLIDLLAARCCTGRGKRAKAGEIVNRSIILKSFLLQDTHQRLIDLGVSSSYLRDELEVIAEQAAAQAAFPQSRFQKWLRAPSSGLRKAPHLLADALLHAPGEHIEEESVIDDAMYALRVLRTSNRLF
jgi:hypothetical protein